MREFIRPFRRKIAVAILAVACASMTLWVRSSYRIDECAVSAPNGFQFIFVSAYQMWGMKFCGEVTDSLEMNSEIISELGGCSTRSKTSFNEAAFFQRRERNVDDGVVKTLEFSVHRNSAPSEALVLHPYWSLVVPLTLISAWLLLGKPRSKPAQTVNRA